MERIGIAASKMSPDSLFLYNFYVILLSFLFSLLIFLVAGATVVFSLIIIRYVTSEIMGVQVFEDWTKILTVCMTGLSILTGLFNLAAISKNIRLTKPKE